jgi:hypothetical protein
MPPTLEGMEGVREVAWAVTRPGCGRAQVSDDFQALVSDVVSAWTDLFPRRLGYSTRTEAVADQVVRLVVHRGDFEGHVELCCELDRHESSRIRAVAQARSKRVIAAEAAGERAIRRARGAAVGLGILGGLGFCWLAAGANMPVVGGLLLTIIVVVLVVGGDNLGSRVGEEFASRRMLTAQLDVGADLGVQADIRRWNSLNRRLRGHRRALARGLSGGPFRRGG